MIIGSSTLIMKLAMVLMSRIGGFEPNPLVLKRNIQPTSLHNIVFRGVPDDQSVVYAELRIFVGDVVTDDVVLNVFHVGNE